MASTELFAVDIPSSADPARLEKRFEKSPMPESKPTKPKEEKKLEQPDKAKDVNVTLKEVKAEGLTVYKYEDLQKTWQSKLGKQTSVKELYEIADAITAKYRNDGWILSQAVIEPQDITSGVLKIKVIEGFADKVLVEGDVLGYKSFFDKYSSELQAQKPLNNASLEKYSMFASELPGISAKAVIRPSNITQGASDVVFVVERKTIDGSIGYDNRGTKTSGPNQLNTSFSVGAPFGLPDKIGISWSMIPRYPHELNYISLSDEHIFSADGLKLTTTFGRSYSHSGGNLEQFDLKSKSNTINTQLTEPLLKSRAKNWSIWGGFNWQNSDSTMLGDPNQRDRSRKIRFGSQYDFSDESGSTTMFNGEYHRGLRVLNSTQNGDTLVSRADGNGDYDKITLDVTRSQPLPYSLMLTAGISAQISDKALFSGEEFGYGGANYGKAYDSSEITGDNGISGKIELSYQSGIQIPTVQNISPYIFYDIAQIYDRANDKSSAASAGFGIRINFLEKMSGLLEWAKPLTREVNANIPDNGKKARVFFSITGRI